MSAALRLILLLICLPLAGCAERSEYPARPITLVCPWSPGGGTDQVSRQMAFFLEHELGVPCTVINATGGQGVTGHSRGLTARPDGYTIAVITFELNTLHWQGLTELTYDDAIPLISVNEDAAAIWVPVDAPWESLDDLLAEVKADPGKLTASGTATGGAWHLALAGWLQSAGVAPDAITWIPMGGADPSIQELMSGGVDLVCCSLPEAKLHFNRGDLKSLGVMSEERAPGFETIPTMLEQDFDWTLVGWRGFAVPLGTPTERVEKLTAAMKKIVTGEVSVNGKTFPEFMEQRGFNNHWRERDDFTAFLKQNDESLGALLTSDAFKKLSEGKIGPYDFPTLLGCVLLGLCVAQVVVSRRRTELKVVPTNRVPSEKAEARFHAPSVLSPRKLGDLGYTLAAQTSPTTRWINVLLAVGAVLFYLFVAETAGFLITSAIILFVLLLRLRTNLLTSIAITLILVPGIYQLFSGLLRVPLPRGWWGW